MASQLVPAATPVYRTAPYPTASTTTLPSVGVAAANDVWEEVYCAGTAQTTTPSYELVAKTGVLFYNPS